MGGRFGKFVLLLAALFYFFIPASSGIAPRQFAMRLGLVISGTSGNEIRAQYACFVLVVGAICVAALLGYATRRSAYVILAILFGGLIAAVRRGRSLFFNGLDGFVCIVGRGWTSAPDPDFWNPKVRVPMCLNAAAARSYLLRIITRTDLILAGRTKAQIDETIAAAVDKR